MLEHKPGYMSVASKVVVKTASISAVLFTGRYEFHIDISKHAYIESAFGYDSYQKARKAGNKVAKHFGWKLNWEN